MAKVKGELCLFLAALIWGSAFVFQKMGMDFIGPLTFGFFRFTVGALALLPAGSAILMDLSKYDEKTGLAMNVETGVGIFI